MRSTIAIDLLHRIAASLWLLAALGSGQSVAAQGLIFQVSRDDGPPSYLVGTMHSEDPRVISMVDALGPLIGRVDTVAIELLPDAVTMLAVGAATLLPLDQSLRSTIGGERFAALSAAAGRLGISSELLDRLKPWAAAVTLGMPASHDGRFMDMEIYLEALRRERRTIGVESAAEQLAVFEGMRPTVQLQLLDAMVKNADGLPKKLEDLTQVYLAGDLNDLDRFARDQYADMPPAVARWFDEELLTRRNDRMVERLSVIMKKQTVLVAVGALHLGGESGLVAGLRRLGYRVEQWRD